MLQLLDQTVAEAEDTEKLCFSISLNRDECHLEKEWRLSVSARADH